MHRTQTMCYHFVVLNKRHGPCLGEWENISPSYIKRGPIIAACLWVAHYMHLRCNLWLYYSAYSLLWVVFCPGWSVYFQEEEVKFKVKTFFTSQFHVFVLWHVCHKKCHRKWIWIWKVAYLTTVKICSLPCYTDMGLHRICWHHQSHVLSQFLFRVCGILPWCCGTNVGSGLWNRLPLIPLTNNWRSAFEDAAGSITSDHGFQKRDTGSGSGEGWSAMIFNAETYDTGWNFNLAKWHLLKTTLQVCFFSRTSWVYNVWLSFFSGREWAC